jgi:hypothetical protein
VSPTYRSNGGTQNQRSRPLFYPILGRQRFDEATFAGPPNVLKPTVRAMRVRKGIGKSLYFVPFDLNARRELAPRDRTFYEERAHCPMPVSPCLRSWSYGRSAANISSRAKGALGEHRRNNSDGMRLEIEAPGCRSSVRRSTAPDLPASRARDGQPGDTRRDGGANRRVEPQGPSARLTSVPDGDEREKPSRSS